MAGNVKPRGRVTRLLRTIHAWMGIFVFPWVIIIGATVLPEPRQDDPVGDRGAEIR